MAKPSIATIESTFLLLLSTVSLLRITIVDGRRHSPFLVEDTEVRRNNRQGVSECLFGKTFYELNSVWSPDLGPPFGVMHCIRCECEAVPRKRRVIARVQCKNIKKECPPTPCDDPVVLPGKCCKTCPGDNYDTQLAHDVPMQVNTEEEDRNMKHFAALLTGRTSYFLKGDDMVAMYSTHNPQNIVATGRFLFHKKNLYYSFYVSGRIGRARAIQFVNTSGTILEENNLNNLNGALSIYQNATGKVCGVWRRVPRDYKRLLREERLHVVLLWGSEHRAELALAGKIGKYNALQTELFSSLMEPAPGTKSDQMAGAGGTAAISTSSGAASSIHLTIVFNGVFSPEEFADVPIVTRIELPDRNNEVILEEIQKVRKPSSEVNVLEISSPISIQNLRLLSRGKLLLTVESKKNPNLRIQGQIITRTTCELFQTLLSPHSSFESKTKSSGLAWVYLNGDGSLVYNIETDHLNINDRPEISLIEDLGGKRKIILEDLSPTFNFNQAMGTIEKLGPKVLELLYGGDLGVNIGIENEPSLIRGRLIPRPVADARDSAEPILLKRQDGATTPTTMHGMAWIAIDNECSLHYEVTVNGFNSNPQEFQIYLEEKPIEAIGAPVTRKLLDEFTGPYMEGFFLEMPPTDLIKLETSVCYLEILSKDRKELLLRGKLKSTRVPSHCYPLFTDNNVPSVILPGDQNDNHLIAPETKCYHSGRFYDEAEQWRSSQEACTMCGCQHGRVTCDPIKCPPVKCRQNEELIQRDGECCPTCISQNAVIQTNNSAERGCRLGDQFYLPGAPWHPYLPPNGFDTCATCSCDPITLEIRCPRIVCPPLTCSEKSAYRPDKKACCKVCPESKSISYNGIGNDRSGANNTNVQHDQASSPRSNIRTADEILRNGGCKFVKEVYENGREWHPVLESHGEQKCIKCRCKDSKVHCDRKRCSRSACISNRVSAKRKVLSSTMAAAAITSGGGGNSLDASTDECCQCPRSRRHQGHRRSHRDRDDKSSTVHYQSVSRFSSNSTRSSGSSS